MTLTPLNWAQRWPELHYTELRDDLNCISLTNRCPELYITELNWHLADLREDTRCISLKSELTPLCCLSLNRTLIASAFKWTQKFVMVTFHKYSALTHRQNTTLYNYCCGCSLLYSAILRSRADSLRSHAILHERIAFCSAFLTIHRSDVLTALAWLAPRETAAISARSVYTIQPRTMSFHAKPHT